MHILINGAITVCVTKVFTVLKKFGLESQSDILQKRVNFHLFILI